MQRPYCVQIGRSAPPKLYRGEPLAITASVAGNQERVHQVLQKAAVPPAPSVRNRGSRRRYTEDGVKKRLPPVNVRLIPDIADAECFAMHFAFQYECALEHECAEAGITQDGLTSEPVREAVLSEALAGAVSRIRTLFQQGGRLRLSPAREGKIEQVPWMSKTVVAPSRAIDMAKYGAIAGSHAAQSKQTTDSQLSGPSIPTAAVSSQTPNAPALATARDHHTLKASDMQQEVRNRFDEAQAKPLVPQQLLSFERQGWTCIKELFAREEVRHGLFVIVFVQKRPGFSVVGDSSVSLQIEHIHKAILPVLGARELEALQQRIRVLCPGVDPYGARTKEAALNILAQHSEEPLGFLQFFNLNK